MFQTFNGKEYMMIEAANTFGLDQLDWDDRISWFKENESQLEDLTKKAKEPALFYASVLAYRNASKGMKNHHPVSLDATASGMQILACLTGDRKTAELCNVVSTDGRKDAYTELYTFMVNELGETAKIDRKQTKTAIMTHFYNSSRIPKQVFGEGELYNVFMETMKTRTPFANELNLFMLDAWDKTATEYNWVLPDNFHVKTKVMDAFSDTIHFMNAPFEIIYYKQAATETGRSLCANMVHSIDGYIVRELIRRCSFDPIMVQYVQSVLDENGLAAAEPNQTDTDMVNTLWVSYKQYGILSARILDHITPDTIKLVDKAVIQDLLSSLPKTPFQIMPVHDCFRVLPNYGNDIRRQYTKLLSEIAKSDLLSMVLTCILRKPVKVGKADPLLWQDILEANYALS